MCKMSRLKSLRWGPTLQPRSVLTPDPLYRHATPILCTHAIVSKSGVLPSGLIEQQMASQATDMEGIMGRLLDCVTMN